MQRGRRDRRSAAFRREREREQNCCDRGKEDDDEDGDGNDDEDRAGADPIDGMTSIFDTRDFFVHLGGMEADCEFTNIRVVASKKKGLRVNRESEVSGK